MCIWKICTIYHALHTYNANFVILFCLHVKRAPGWVWMFREHWKWACWPMNVNVSPSFAAVLHRFTLYGNMQQLRALRPEWRRTVIWTFQNLWRFVLVDDTRLFPVSASSEVKEMFLLSWFHFDNFPEDVLLEHVNTAFLFFNTQPVCTISSGSWKQSPHFSASTLSRGPQHILVLAGSLWLPFCYPICFAIKIGQISQVKSNSDLVKW